MNAAPRSYFSESNAYHRTTIVIDRMANGANRAECSPELDRVIAALREIDGDA